MERRKFLKISSLLYFGLIASTKLKASVFLNNVNKYKEKIIKLILELNNEGSNLVQKVMNGKKYAFDPYTHYPQDGGIKDENTGSQLFFHIHRDAEYGHFHTFSKDENGELVHLILISMNKEGEPIGLATVNRWVTGDKYVNGEILNKLTQNFFVDTSLFSDSRVVDFVNNIFKAYAEEIKQLYSERDKWILNYVNQNYREPFEDRDYEILSFKKIQ